MSHWRLIAFIFATLPATPILQAQWICSTQDGKPCTAEDVDRMVCKPEAAPANLTVAQHTLLEGTLKDSSGALFPSTEDTIISIQLRDAKTGKILNSANVTQTARFGLGTVEEGSFRLIAVALRSGHTERLRGWVQPHGLSCSDGPTCDLKVVMKPGSTDNPLDFCPPK